MKITQILFSILILVAGQCAAQEFEDGQSLYDLAPADSAYVRLINTTGEPISLKVGDKTLQAATFCSVSPIVWVAPSTEISGEFSSVSAIAGELYTVVVGHQIDILAESKNDDPFKASLGAYNLTDAAISVVTTAGLRPVFKDLPVGAAASRQLNAITVALTSLVSELPLSLGQVSLKRGQKTDTFICESKGELAFAISEY